MSSKVKTRQPYKEEHHEEKPKEELEENPEYIRTYEEELKETVRQNFEYYKNKFVKVDKFVNNVLRSLEMKNLNCEYVIDELPYIYSSQSIGHHVLEDNYIEYEHARDKIICRNLSVPERYVIVVFSKRVYTHVGDIRSFLILDVGDIIIYREIIRK